MNKKLTICLVLFFVIGTISIYIFFYLEAFNKFDLKLLQSQQITPWGIKSINVPQKLTKSGDKVIKIAIMDSGIDFKHPDFDDNIKPGFNTITTTESPTDDYGHGTLVAGVIGAKNNSIGIKGLVPNAEIYPVKVLDKYGEGEITDIASGIDWCIENKIQIINMSFAIEEDKPILRSSIKKATDAGIIIVASAMNTYGGKAGYPASYHNVISVTAVDDKYQICKTAPVGKIDFSAPGVDIISTRMGGDYEEYTGTSIATPRVTGIIALILQSPEYFGLKSDSTFGVKEIYRVLKKLSKDLGEKGSDNTYGEGFVSIKN